jgi:hypothetical protein
MKELFAEQRTYSLVPREEVDQSTGANDANRTAINPKPPFASINSNAGPCPLSGHSRGRSSVGIIADQTDIRIAGCAEWADALDAGEGK